MKRHCKNCGHELIFNVDTDDWVHFTDEPSKSCSKDCTFLNKCSCTFPEPKYDLNPEIEKLRGCATPAPAKEQTDLELGTEGYYKIIKPEKQMGYVRVVKKEGRFSYYILNCNGEETSISSNLAGSKMYLWDIFNGRFWGCEAIPVKMKPIKKEYEVMAEEHEKPPFKIGDKVMAKYSEGIICGIKIDKYRDNQIEYCIDFGDYEYWHNQEDLELVETGGV